MVDSGRLVVKNATLVRRGRMLACGLNCQIPAGGVCLLTGANGSGKTSLLRLIAGLSPLEQGEIFYTGAAPDRPLENYCHLLSERNGLKPLLTPLQNLKFYQKLLPGEGIIDRSLPNNSFQPRALTPSQALRQVGLISLANFPCGILSSGQKNRLAFARLLVTSRPIWLLDEPFNTLDVKARNAITKHIKFHLVSNGIVVIASHLKPALAITATITLGDVYG